MRPPWFAFGKGYLVHGLLFSISVAVKFTISKNFLLGSEPPQRQWYFALKLVRAGAARLAMQIFYDLNFI